MLNLDIQIGLTHSGIPLAGEENRNTGNLTPEPTSRLYMKWSTRLLKTKPPFPIRERVTRPEAHSSLGLSCLATEIRPQKSGLSNGKRLPLGKPSSPLSPLGVRKPI